METLTDILPTPSELVVPPSDPSPVDPFVALSYPELKPAEDRQRDWLWQGYLLPGAVTLLTSMWKSGKSTLLSVLLSRLKTGGVLAGLPVRAGRAVVVSEESPDLWWGRGHNLDLAGHVHWFCKPFQGKPTHEQWLSLLAQIGRMHERRPIDLLAIDPLASLAPMRTENDAAEMMKAVTPLQALTARGVSVLLTHHPPKGPIVPGQAARGSGALSACVDIILEMHNVFRRSLKDRRRRLRAYSRYAATLPEWIIEWTADGADYVALGTSPERDFEHTWPELHTVLENAEKSLTRRDIRRAWPDPAAAPPRQTLWRWLNQAVREGRVLKYGQGTRRDPFCYALPGMLEKWQAKMIADFTRRLEEDDPLAQRRPMS